MKRLLLILFSFISFSLCAQTWQGALETRLNLNNGVPFGLRANQYGSMPLSDASATLLARGYRHYTSPKSLNPSFFDWGLGLEARADQGRETRFTIIEGYGKVKAGFLEVRGGRFKEFLGLTDSTLSIGSFSISGNALGIPKVELRVPEYWPKNTLISGRGNYAHGWYGDIPMARAEGSLYTYLHQKSLWLRIARPHWKLKLYGGLVDNAFWGDEYKMHTSFRMSKPQRYWAVVSGQNWQGSKVGNHLGSFDARAEYQLKHYRIAAYRQFFYEVGGLWHLANIADGLMGVSVQKKTPGSGAMDWSKLLMEVLYTKHQAGELSSRATPTGAENYYNHYLYSYGWSYRGLALGSPFITPAHTARQNLPNTTTHYFINNRLWAVHLGADGSLRKWLGTVKLSYSKNFGTYATGTHPYLTLDGELAYPQEESFPVSNQFSFYLQARRALKNGFHAGFMLAADNGQLLPNSSGLTLSLEKRF